VGRALTFSDPRIIRLLQEQFVPVAANINMLQRQDDEEGRFLRLAAWQGRFGLSFEEARVRMADPEHKECHQGQFVVTTEGELLGSRHTRDPHLLLEVLEKALENWARRTTQLTASEVGEVQDRDLQYVWRYPEDGLVLHLGCMDLPRQVDLRPEDWPREAHNQDYVWITREEMLDILPEGAQVGDAFPMYGPVARRLIRYHFLDSVRGETSAWPAERLGDAEMTLTVTGATSDRVEARLAGHVRLVEQGAWCGRRRNDGICCLIQERGYDAQALGYLTFDRKGGRFTRFDVMVAGTRWGGTTFNMRYNDVEPAPLGIAFTIAGREARDRTPPHASPGRYFEA
jgi:hypothetical protein